MGFFILVLVLGNALRDISAKLASAKLSISSALYLMGLIIPSVLPYALPMGLLTAILLVFGRMSSQQEITAAKAAGFSVLNIARPVFLLAGFCLVLSLFINLYYAPIAGTRYKRSLVNLVKENPLRFIEAKSFIDDFPGYIFYIRKQEKQELQDLWIWELNPQKQVNVFIRAQRGFFSFEDKTETLTMHIIDGVAEKKDTQGSGHENLHSPLLFFKELALQLPLDTILGSNYNRKMGLHTVSELIALQKPYLEATHPKYEERYKYHIKVNVEIQKKFAMAFSILSLVLLGIPLSIKVSRKETLVNMILALGLALGYYALLIICSWAEAVPHYRPDILIWIPNLLFQGVGLFFLRKANNIL